MSPTRKCADKKTINLLSPAFRLVTHPISGLARIFEKVYAEERRFEHSFEKVSAEARKHILQMVCLFVCFQFILSELVRISSY